jgi:acyl dehydratase
LAAEAVPIDIERVLAAEFPLTTYTWTDRDVILYHLGIGAGNPPTDETELRYTYEGDLRVLPSFATIPPFQTMMSLGNVDGMDINLSQILHGEQETVVHRPIPTSGTVRHRAAVVGVYDKGKGALAVIEIESTEEKSGEILFTNRSSIFIRGEGGFDGEQGPSTKVEVPDRQPDHSVDSPTMPQQALLYRMSSGDLNPLHVDPGFAMFAGYDRPILHGLCTYGIVLKAAVDSVFGGDPTTVERYSARFTGVVFPGETIATELWQAEDGLFIRARTVERSEPVLTGIVVAAGG